MGDVVTASPSLKLGDPEIKPDIDPSRFCFHLLIVGTPLGAAETCCGLATAGALSDAGGEPRVNVPKLKGFFGLSDTGAAA
eukprot:2509568-Ditylum_brightwellii.AAC.1